MQPISQIAECKRRFLATLFVKISSYKVDKFDFFFQILLQNNCWSVMKGWTWKGLFFLKNYFYLIIKNCSICILASRLLMQFSDSHYFQHLHFFYGCCILAKAKKLHCVLSSSNHINDFPLIQYAIWQRAERKKPLSFSFPALKLPIQSRRVDEKVTLYACTYHWRGAQ